MAASAATAPLCGAAFAAAMAGLGPFEHRPAIAVGVSGGPDSMALALLLRDWLAARDGHLLALVVDHRLRAESSAEAALVVARLEALGMDARLLVREGPVPPTALQAEARLARYQLLAAAAAEAGMLHLAVAHHLEDQLETIALRRASGSGWRGLAGMAPVRELDRVRLIRPLLQVPRARLRALLTAQGVAWLEDPSNRDRRFWRARHRAAAAREQPDPAEVTAAAARRAASDRALAAVLAAHGRPHALGFTELALAPLALLVPEPRRQLLGRLVAATAGRVWPPGRRQLERLDDWLCRRTTPRMTLGGVVVERLADRLRFLREPRAVAGPLAVPPEGVLWDGRFRILPFAAAPAGLTVQAAGVGWRRRLAAAGVDRRQLTLPAMVLATLPLVSADGRAIRLGPWPLGDAGRLLFIACRPVVRHTDVPFGHSLSGSVATLTV